MSLPIGRSAGNLTRLSDVPRRRVGRQATLADNGGPDGRGCRLTNATVGPLRRRPVRVSVHLSSRLRAGSDGSHPTGKMWRWGAT